MESFALQKSFRTEALCWLSKQGWTGWPDKSGAVYSRLTFLSPVQASLSTGLSLFCFWLCCSTCSCMPSKPNIFSQMWACHSRWLEWDVCTQNCGQSMAPRLYTTVKYICYIYLKMTFRYLVTPSPSNSVLGCICLAVSWAERWASSCYNLTGNQERWLSVKISLRASKSHIHLSAPPFIGTVYWLVKYTVLLFLLPEQHLSDHVPLPFYKYADGLWLNLFYLLAVSWSFLLSPRIMRKVLFFCCAATARHVSCGLRALMRSPESSVRAFYVLQTPGATHLSVWNRTVPISTYFYLSAYLNINLYIQLSSQAEADSYSFPCCLQHKTTLSFMHRAGMLIPGAI